MRLNGDDSRTLLRALVEIYYTCKDHIDLFFANPYVNPGVIILDID